MSNNADIYFSQENVQMETIYPICRELQIKTTVRYHYVPIRVTKIPPKLPIAHRGVEQQEFLFIAGGDANVPAFGRQFGSFFQS